MLYRPPSSPLQQMLHNDLNQAQILFAKSLQTACHILVSIHQIASLCNKDSRTYG